MFLRVIHFIFHLCRYSGGDKPGQVLSARLVILRNRLTFLSLLDIPEDPLKNGERPVIDSYAEEVVKSMHAKGR
jgi:hypothetical protein